MGKSFDNVKQVVKADEDDVLESVHALMHLVRSRQLRSLGAGLQELAPMEGKVLGYFSRHPGATQSDLASHSGRDRGQLGRLIAGMKEKGLLCLEPDTEDRRVMRIHLTDAAQALHRDFQRQRKALSVQAVAGLDAAEKLQLLALLRRVRANLQSAD